MLGMNQVELIGILVKDPDITKLPDGVLMVRYTLRINHMYKNTDGNYEHDDVDCVSYGQMAQRIARKLKEGMSLGIVGHIQTMHLSADAKKTDGGRPVEVVATEISYMEAPEKVCS